MKHLIPFLFLTWLVSLTFSCSTSDKTAQQEHHLPDTLTVGTLYSPTGFFILKGDTMGYDYDRICDFAQSHGIALRFQVARSMPELLDMLKKQYPKAELYSILNSELNEDVNESMREVCKHYGVQLIELHDIEKQNGHPSISGMKAICDQLLEAIK